MVEGQKTNENNDQLLISVKEPYKNLIEITGFTYSVKGEGESTYYQKDFRWSTDGVLYNDWQPLDNEHLQRLLIDPDKDFWPQYRFTHIGEGELEFISIALETVTDAGAISNIVMCGINDNGKCCGQQNLVFDCCGSGFNPYAVGNSASVYTQLSQVISNMFGFCVRYFKTSSDQRSRDVILHEYSLLNVMQEGNIKIIVPDNNLPTREISFSAYMMDYPVSFEVHIVKNAFRSVFGQDAKPEVGDYLYFEQYMNKMYEITSTSETDDFLYTGAYWRINLGIYQKRAAVKFDTPELETEVDTLIFNEDKFNIETLEQERDARKPEQYNTIGKLENDYIRRVLDKKLHISTENIYNSWTIISKSQYNLKSLEKGSKAVVYRYNGGWANSDERMFTMWIRPKWEKAMSAKIAVDTLMDVDKKLAIRLSKETNSIHKGDLIRLTGTDYPKMVRVTRVDGDIVYTSLNFINDCMNNPAVVPLTTNEFFNSEGGFSLSHTHDTLCVSLNGNDLMFTINSQSGIPPFVPDKWYGLVIMLKPSEEKCGVWVYTCTDGDGNIMNMDSELNRVHYSLKDNCGDITCNDGYWWLESCDMDITNIRIWNRLCEEHLHNLILSQYIVKDSHLCELIDNAQPELLVDRVTNPR